MKKPKPEVILLIDYFWNQIIQPLVNIRHPRKQVKIIDQENSFNYLVRIALYALIAILLQFILASLISTDIRITIVPGEALLRLLRALLLVPMILIGISVGPNIVPVKHKLKLSVYFAVVLAIYYPIVLFLFYYLFLISENYLFYFAILLLFLPYILFLILYTPFTLKRKGWRWLSMLLNALAYLLTSLIFFYANLAFALSPNDFTDTILFDPITSEYIHVLDPALHLDKSIELDSEINIQDKTIVDTIGKGVLDKQSLAQFESSGDNYKHYSQDLDNETKSVQDLISKLHFRHNLTIASGYLALLLSEKEAVNRTIVLLNQLAQNPDIFLSNDLIKSYLECVPKLDI